MKVDALFPDDPHLQGNASIDRWRELLQRGFPFVKVQLLRENPRDVDLSDWRSAVDAAGGVSSTIDAYMRELVTDWDRIAESGKRGVAPTAQG